MDVGVRLELPAGGVVGDVEGLRAHVVRVADAMFIVAGMPDVLAEERTRGMREAAAFDELDASGGALVERGCDQDVYVVGHDDEGVEMEFAGVAIAEEGCDEELGEGGLLEDRALAKG